jgi:crotonobetainyl-CoA:carnitine CoA-transferase CaiB-like acyl-CoA transferase
VVVAASRPRALASLGLDPVAWVATGARPRVWLSITGYGWTGPGANRVAFGDDAAVAGGLVVWDERGPCFCADAVADPLTGLVGAARVLDALVAGRSELVDLSMARVAAGFAARTAVVAVRR